MVIRPDRVQRITNVQPGRSVDREYRVRRYLISMGIRTLCFVGAVVVPGFWKWLLVAAAVALPYISVVLANTITVRQENPVLPPLIVKDTRELPLSHPDRTHDVPRPAAAADSAAGPDSPSSSTSTTGRFDTQPEV